MTLKQSHQVKSMDLVVVVRWVASHHKKQLAPSSERVREQRRRGHYTGRRACWVCRQLSPQRLALKDAV